MGINTVIIMAVSFFVFAILGSLGLNYLAVAVNSSVNSTVKTVAVTVVSILFAVGVAMRYIPKGKD